MGSSEFISKCLALSTPPHHHVEPTRLRDRVIAAHFSTRTVRCRKSVSGGARARLRPTVLCTHNSFDVFFPCSGGSINPFAWLCTVFPFQLPESTGEPCRPVVSRVSIAIACGGTAGPFLACRVRRLGTLADSAICAGCNLVCAIARPQSPVHAGSGPHSTIKRSGFGGG